MEQGFELRFGRLKIPMQLSLSHDVCVCVGCVCMCGMYVCIHVMCVHMVCVCVHGGMCVCGVYVWYVWYVFVCV